jgi:uncharacterized RDD family membrane protein YckC
MNKKMKKRQLKPKKDNTQYAGFQIRMLSNLIDLILISILFFPIFSVLSAVIYGNVLPGEVITKVINEMAEVSKGDPSFSASLFFKNSLDIREYFINNHGIEKLIIYSISQVLIIIATFLLFWIKKQATPGKRLLSIKIVDATTLAKPTSKQLIIRAFAILISSLPFLMGIIWLVFDPRKQTWHDKIANTLVIKEPK